MVLNKIIIFLTIVLSVVAAPSSNTCFIAKENGKIVKQEGNCDERHSPFSTFKIPLALMGFDSGILQSSEEPLWDFTDEIKARFGSPLEVSVQFFWYRPQTPKTWMRYSVVWYSQEITRKLGLKKFQHYISLLNYGNKDVSGTPGKNDGLLNSWLGSSLQISALEQVEFIERLSKRELPLSKSAQENTAKLIELESIWDDWKLYGKVGGGCWFVGWIEKGNRSISFAQYIGPQDCPIRIGTLAKEVAKNKLVSIILS